MEVKKAKSLNVFFFQFLLRIILYIALAVALWLVLFMAVIRFNLLIPANTIEQQVTEWKSQMQRKQSLSFKDFPERTGYLLWDEQMGMQTYQLTERQIENATELLQSSDEKRVYAWGNTVYDKVETDVQTCIVVYSLYATFKNPFLSKIFPSAEIILIAILFLMIVLVVIVATLRTAGKMKKDALKMQEAAKKIREQNLDFDVPKTNIREFNGVLSALEQLKCSLESSLELQWKLEQDKKKQMSALAHDIKTPLTVIEGNAQMLMESSLPLEEHEYAEYINNNVQQIQDYVKQMIDISKNQVEEPKAAAILLPWFLEEVTKEALQLAQLKNISILFESEEIGVSESFMGDVKGLHRAFMNVLSNAVRFTPEGGEIHTQAEIIEASGKKWMRYTVSDSGEGFSAEALLHAKEQFYQDDKSRSGKEHYGMGLYIAEQFINAAGGRLTLENEKSGGKVVIEICLEKKCV